MKKAGPEGKGDVPKGHMKNFYQRGLLTHNLVCNIIPGFKEWTVHLGKQNVDQYMEEKSQRNMKRYNMIANK